MLQGFLMRTSLTQLVRLGVGGGVSIVGGALALRQQHLHSHPVVEATAQQLRAAQAVEKLLGSAVASTSGVLGGYTDPIGGTACITIPVVSQGGVRAIARVEAEAEWLVQRAQAEARGEEPAAPTKGETCRWLLRHLEIERADTHATGETPTVLYSLPPNAPLSPWAPSRSPSASPRWLRALLPEPQGVVQSELTPRLILVGACTVALHAIVFGVLHKKMLNEKMLRRAETMLTLPETPAHTALATRAMELVAEVAPDGARKMVRHAGAPLYGHATSARVMAFTSLTNQQELFFSAERSATQASSRVRSQHARSPQQRPGEEWTLTQLSVGFSSAFAKRLERLPADADETALLEAVLSVQTRPIDVGLLDRRVSVYVQ
jgi:hypothetical protein